MAQAFAEGTNAVSEIVVTAARIETQLSLTPETMQVISAQDIKETQSSSTGQLFEYTTGAATATGTGSGAPKRSVISLNGLPAKYTMVLVDGVPLLSEHIHTGQNVELVPPHMIERIEVLRGAAGAQYGSDAMGGVVNIITKKGADEFGGSISTSVGSFDTYQTQLSAGMPLAEGVYLSSSVNWEKSDGQPLLEPSSRVDQTGYENVIFYNRLDVKLSDETRLFATVNGAENELEWKGDIYESHQLTLAGGVDQEISDDLTLFARISHSDWEADLSSELNRVTKPELFMRWDVNEDHTLMLGGDYSYNTFERTAVASHSQQSYGTFLQDEWQISDTFSLLGALRFDHVEGVASAVSPKIAALWLPTDRLSVRASISRGFHAPTLQELYEEGYGHGGTAYRFGNEDLEPEYSTTYTTGVELEVADGVSVMMNLFYTDFTDMIVPVYEGAWSEDPTIDVWRRTNISEAVVYGTDLGLHWELTDRVRLESGCTLSHCENKQDSGSMSYQPGGSAYSKLVFEDSIQGRDVLAFFGARSAFNREAWSWKPAESGSTDSDGVTTKLGDYVSWDAGVTVGLTDQVETFVKVENILGEDIENLDDLYTVIDGAPFVRGGLTYKF